MKKLKDSNCDKTLTQIVTKGKNTNSEKIKNYDCDKTQKLKLWQNSKTYCDKTQKLKLWQNSKAKIVTKLKNSNGEKLTSDSSDICDSSDKKIQSHFFFFCLSLKLWQNSKTQIMTKLKKSNV